MATDRWSAGPDLLVDNSVWARTDHPSIEPVWKAGLGRRRLVACPPFVMEAGYSTRTAAELMHIRRVLAIAMDVVVSDAETWEIAFAAQAAMAEAAGLMHRRKPMDFLVAATAHQHGLGVLHYDRDFDLIAEHGGLDFASVWVVPQGSLEA